VQVDSPELEQELARLETQQIQRCYKFGILYRRAGQRTEDEIYANGIYILYLSLSCSYAMYGSMRLT
jgi:hypothetical protein